MRVLCSRRRAHKIIIADCSLPFAPFVIHPCRDVTGDGYCLRLSAVISFRINALYCIVTATVTVLLAEQGEGKETDAHKKKKNKTYLYTQRVPIVCVCDSFFPPHFPRVNTRARWYCAHGRPCGWFKGVLTHDPAVKIDCLH